MKDKICDLEKCTGCSCCRNICPVNAITMIMNEEGFEVPVINKDKCISCELCRRKCPVNDKMKDYFNDTAHIAYAGKSENISMQLSCTSGGVFTALALEFVQNKGIVYGAAYNCDYVVNHIRVDKPEEIVKLSDSKYSQSIIGDSYQKVKKDLNDGRRVLFSGTSCQISGLYHFLGRKPQNLYCIDVICHGIPSPGIWKWYIDKCKEKYKKNIELIRHRGKELGGWNWKEQFYEVRFEDGLSIKENIWKNPYISGFLNDLYLRPSCHTCQYKNKEIQRVADMTLADYWGCEDIEKEFYDSNGISLIIVNNEKGSELLQKTNSLCLKETSLNDAIKYNVAAYRSYPVHKGRKFFFEQFSQEITLERFKEIVEKGIALKDKSSIYDKLKRKIKKFLKLILIKVGVYNNG